MKKFVWLFIVCLFLGVTTSCKKKEDPTPKPDDDKPNLDELLKDDPNATHVRVYFECNNGQDLICVEVEKGKKVSKIATPTKEGYLFTNWYADSALTAKFNFYDKIYNSMILYAGWVEDTSKDYSYVIENAVPNIVTGDLDFPQRSDDGLNASFTWSTSLPYTISDHGVVNKGRKELEVLVTLEAYDGKATKVYTKPCIVEPITFSELRPGKMIFGYASTWHYSPFTEEQLMVDAINLSFAYVNSDATVDLSSCMGYFDDFLAVRKHGVRAILSIQGAGKNTANFSNAASTPEKRARFASDVVNILETYHFDGVDIDWEYPGDSYAIDKEKVAYSLLMEELYRQVKEANPDYLVTGALPGGAYGWRRYDLKRLSTSMDFIHLMTYDMEASANVLHHTALYSNMPKATATQASVNDSVELYTLAGFPIEKLTVGIAFYGKMTTATTSANGGLGSKSATGDYSTITYTRIKNNYLSEVGKTVEYHWDNICKAPYLFKPDTKTFITYDNEKSILEKCKYAWKNQMAGVMIWELGEDKTMDLMNAVLEGTKRK